MQFNAKDDFVTEQEIKEEQEQLEEETNATLEDHDMDKKKDVTTMDFWTEQDFENERQGGKSIFDDSEDLDDNQY